MFILVISVEKKTQIVSLVGSRSSLSSIVHDVLHAFKVGRTFQGCDMHEDELFGTLAGTNITNLRLMLETTCLACSRLASCYIGMFVFILN